MAPRTDRPRAAFDPVRPHRLDVFRALTDRESADDPHWSDLDGPYRLRNFDTYRNDEVSLNIHLRKRDRGSGSWVGVLAGAWRKLAVSDPAEASERLSGLGYCPAPGADPRRAFATDCEACDGIGTVRAASGSRRACEGCAVARIGSRRRGCGYTLADAPQGYGAINAVAHWAMLGTPTILAAEELARETFARAMPAGREALRTVAWLPVVPRTWEPIAQKRIVSTFAEAFGLQVERLLLMVGYDVGSWGPMPWRSFGDVLRSTARFASSRNFDRVRCQRAEDYLRALDCGYFDAVLPALAPARRLLDLGLALHDLDGDASVAVIAYPTQ